MIKFCELSVLFKCLFLLVTFAVSCADLCLVIEAFKSKKTLNKLLAILMALVSFFLSVLCIGSSLVSGGESLKNVAQGSFGSAEPLSRLSGFASTEAIFERTTAIHVASLLFVLALASVWGWLKAVSRHKNSISSASAREGFDELDTGICFSRADGTIIFANRCMVQACDAVMGRMPKDAFELWAVLNGLDQGLKSKRLSYGACPAFRLADGTVRTFKREVIGDLVQTLVTDTTQIHIVNETLKIKNVKLAAINLRLRKYGENVNELTRSRERLETKAQIHNELGQTLMATRRFLLNSADDKTPPFELWKRTVSMLRSGLEAPSRENPLEILKRVADSSGVKVEISGSLPQRKSAEQFFTEAATEALTNAVIHGKAKVMHITLKETETSYSVSFTNDGALPENGITEGGGLSSLRKKAERLGGKMTVLCDGSYILTLTLPKERGEEL